MLKLFRPDTNVARLAAHRRSSYPFIQAYMRGHAHPPAILIHPGIGEAADVVVRLAFIGPLRVIDAGDHRGIAEEIHLHVGDMRQSRLEEGILDVCQKSLLVSEFAIPLGVDEATGDQRVEG